MKICPNCQKEYDDSMAFCVECGSHLADFQPVVEEPKLTYAKTQLLEDEPRFCLNCGNQLDDDSVFCTACGTKIVDMQPVVEETELNCGETQVLTPETRVCFNCGNSLDDNALFCTACGTKIDSLVTSQQQTVPEVKCCSKCGAQLDDNAAFCTVCGAPATTVNTQQVNPTIAYNTNTTNTYSYNANPAPIGQLKTNKGLLKTILLSIITLGIYPIVVMSSVSNDINVVASRYDGKKTMHFCLLLFIVAPFTLGIGAIVWYHRISARIGAELDRRGIGYSFGAGSFWLWSVLGSLIVIGPLVYMHKLFKAVNLMNADYNMKG